MHTSPWGCYVWDGGIWIWNTDGPPAVSRDVIELPDERVESYKEGAGQFYVKRQRKR